MLDVNVSLVKPLPTLTASRCVSESSIKASVRVGVCVSGFSQFFLPKAACVSQFVLGQQGQSSCRSEWGYL